MTEQLKPCPFCGSEPHDAHHIEYGRWAVTCNCGVMGACANAGPNASDAAKIKAYNDARHAWNTRALTAAQPAQAEREAFEAEMGCEETWGHRSLKKRPDGRYQNWQVDVMWSVWQRRAALPAPQQATPEPVGEQDGVQVLRNALILAANRLDLLWVYLPFGSRPRRDATDWGKEARQAAATTRPAPGVPEGFTSAPPTEQGWYWHWNGDEDSRPIPTSVLWSGSTGTCFVSRGQLGLSEAIDCDKYGGYWLKLNEPWAALAAAQAKGVQA